MFSDVIPQNISRSGYSVFAAANAQDMIFDHSGIEGECLDVYVDYAFNHYVEVLIETPGVWRWFEERKIFLTHEMVEKFRIGFADRTLCKDFRRNKGRQAELVRGALQQLGILKASGHQFLLGDAVVPLFDIDGRIVGAYGRRISPENRHNHIYHHHWEYRKPIFFNVGALTKFNQLIFTKNPFEALLLICAGFENVIAPMGMYSFGQDHLELLEKYKPNEIILAFDTSDAGNLVSGMIAQALDSVSIACKRLPLPKDKDLIAYAQGFDDHVEKLEALVSSAYRYKQTFENILRG